MNRHKQDLSAVFALLTLWACADSESSLQQSSPVEQHEQALDLAASAALTNEERDIVARVGAGGMPDLVRTSEEEYLQGAGKANSRELERRYLLALNLAAKIVPNTSTANEAQAIKQAQYLEAVRLQEAQLSGKSEAERLEALAAQKDKFFSESAHK